MLRPSAPLASGERGASVAAPRLPASAARSASATRPPRKPRILDAGEREFAARGFAGARLREIAETAGVQPALIHHYFTDKQGLYRAVLDRALLPTSTESWSLLGSRPRPRGPARRASSSCSSASTRQHHNLLSILRHEALSGSSVLVELHRGAHAADHRGALPLPRGAPGARARCAPTCPRARSSSRACRWWSTPSSRRACSR